MSISVIYLKLFFTSCSIYFVSCKIRPIFVDNVVVLSITNSLLLLFFIVFIQVLREIFVFQNPQTNYSVHFRQHLSNQRSRLLTNYERNI